VPSFYPRNIFRACVTVYLARFQLFLDDITSLYTRSLDWCFGNKAKLIASVAFLFAISLLLLPRLGREFFPPVDAGQITLRLRAPSNLKLDSTEERVKTVEQFLRRNIPVEDLEMIVSEIGLDSDWSAAYTTNAGRAGCGDPCRSCTLQTLEERSGYTLLNCAKLSRASLLLLISGPSSIPAEWFPRL
jgi:hypothetical protein